MTDTYKGRHSAPAEAQASWWRRLVKRLGMTGTIALVLVVVMAVAAVAAIMLRAEVTGSASTGSAVQFEFGIDDGADNYTDGALTGLYMTDDGAGNWSGAPMPAALGCAITTTGGVLDVAMTGAWLPGEACGIMGAGATGRVYLTNPSSVDVSVIAWDYGTSDAGPAGSGSDLEVILIDATYGNEQGLPSSVAAGGAFGTGLVVKVAPTALFDAAFVLDTTAVIGETTR